MEAPEEKRTPHSDITSFLILSNNHFLRNIEKVSFREEKIYKQPILRGLAVLIPDKIKIPKPSSTYDNGIQPITCHDWNPHYKKHIKSLTVKAELEDVATKQVRLSLELTDHQDQSHQEVLCCEKDVSLSMEFDSYGFYTFGSVPSESYRSEDYKRRCKDEASLYPLQVTLGMDCTMVVEFTQPDGTKGNLCKAFDGIASSHAGLALACVFPFLAEGDQGIDNLQCELARKIADVMNSMVKNLQMGLPVREGSFQWQLNNQILTVIKTFFENFVGVEFDKYCSKRSRQRSARGERMHKMICDLKANFKDVTLLKQWEISDSDRLRNMVRELLKHKSNTDFEEYICTNYAHIVDDVSKLKHKLTNERLRTLSKINITSAIFTLFINCFKKKLACLPPVQHPNLPALVLEGSPKSSTVLKNYYLVICYEYPVSQLHVYDATLGTKKFSKPIGYKSEDGREILGYEFFDVDPVAEIVYIQVNYENNMIDLMILTMQNIESPDWKEGLPSVYNLDKPAGKYMSCSSSEFNVVDGKITCLHSLTSGNRPLVMKIFSSNRKELFSTEILTPFYYHFYPKTFWCNPNSRCFVFISRAFDNTPYYLGYLYESKVKDPMQIYIYDGSSVLHSIPFGLCPDQITSIRGFTRTDTSKNSYYYLVLEKQLFMLTLWRCELSPNRCKAYKVNVGLQKVQKQLQQLFPTKEEDNYWVAGTLKGVRGQRGMRFWTTYVRHKDEGPGKPVGMWIRTYALKLRI